MPVEGIVLTDAELDHTLGIVLLREARLILARQQMGWPFLAPPGLPPERAQALRQAFDATMKDAEFLAEAKQRQMDVNPMSAAAIDLLT